MPSTTSPKIVCLPFSQSVGASVMKNWLPLVFGPALAMASRPARSNFSFGSISSSKRVARAAAAGALGVAALDHEVGDDAVEGQAVVERLGLCPACLWPGRGCPREFDEVGHRLRRPVVEQPDREVPSLVTKRAYVPGVNVFSLCDGGACAWGVDASRIAAQAAWRRM